MGNTTIHELSPRTIIVIAKLVYAGHQNGIIDLDDLNKSIRKLGISTDLNLDVSFIYEVIRMNDERFENNTISPENLILPEKQSINIEYYRTQSETVTYYYRTEVESFSKKKGILQNFFNYGEGDDFIDTDELEDDYKDYGDTEYLDGGLSKIF